MSATTGARGAGDLLEKTGAVCGGVTQADVTIDVTASKFKSGGGTHTAHLSNDDLCSILNVDGLGFARPNGISVSCTNNSDALISMTAHAGMPGDSVSLQSPTRHSVATDDGITHHHAVFDPRTVTPDRFVPLEFNSPDVGQAARQHARWKRHVGQTETKALLKNCFTINGDGGMSRTIVPFGEHESEMGALQALVSRNRGSSAFAKTITGKGKLDTIEYQSKTCAVFDADAVSSMQKQLSTKLAAESFIPGGKNGLSFCFRKHCMESGAPHGVGDDGSELYGATSTEASGGATFKISFHNKPLQEGQSTTLASVLGELEGSGATVISTSSAPPASPSDASVHELCGLVDGFSVGNATVEAH